MDQRPAIWIFAAIGLVVLGVGFLMLRARDTAEAERRALEESAGDPGVQEDRRVPEGIDVRFLIGLGSLNAGRDPSLQRISPGQATLEPFEFDEAVADAQRGAAIGEGSRYRDGTPYQLRDAKGLLPVWWMPRTPFGTAATGACNVAEAHRALANARAGRSYEPTHVSGGWLYASPDWYGPGQPGFGAADIRNVAAATNPLGHLAINYEIIPERADDFHDYTEEFVGHVKAVVIGGEIIIAPRVAEPMADRVQLSGGLAGFSEEEQHYVLRAFGLDY